MLEGWVSAACGGRGQAPAQLEAGPGGRWVRAGPPPRVSFPDGFPVFCSGARCRGGVRTGVGCGHGGVRVRVLRRAPRCQRSPCERGGRGAGPGAARQWRAQIAARRKRRGSGADGSAAASVPAGLAMAQPAAEPSAPGTAAQPWGDGPRGISHPSPALCPPPHPAEAELGPSMHPAWCLPLTQQHPASSKKGLGAGAGFPFPGALRPGHPWLELAACPHKGKWRPFGVKHHKICAWALSPGCNSCAVEV